MQDGEEMGYIKIYVGPLLAQVTFIYDGKLMSKKAYHKLCDRNPKMPRFEQIEEYHFLAAELKLERERQRDQIRVAEQRPDPKMRKQLDEFCEGLLNPDDSQEVISWLKDRSKGTRTLGELQTTKASLQLARKLYSLGAKKVFAVEIDESGGGNSGKLVIALPKQVKNRKRLFRWCAEQARSQGFGPDPDLGQKYALMMLD